MLECIYRIFCCPVVGDLVIVKVNTPLSTLLEAAPDCRRKLSLVTEHEHRDHWTVAWLTVREPVLNMSCLSVSFHRQKAFT